MTPTRARRTVLLLLAGATVGVSACSTPAAAPLSTASVTSRAPVTEPPASSTADSSSGAATGASNGTASAPSTAGGNPSAPAPAGSSADAPSTPLLSGPQQPAGDPSDIVTGLAAPWSVVFVGDTALVSERDSGLIRQLGPDGLRDVGTVAGVAARGEGGLLGLAPYPAVAPTMLYAYFTGVDDNRIVRFPLTGDASAGYGLGPAEDVFNGIIKNSTHNGGRIAFGPDGMLYVTAGDAQQRDTPQDPDALNGKILRLTPDGAVPADNPIAGNPMYSMGHRNPQGLAWDATGQLWAAEFGQDTWDELNRIVPGGNYGWPVVEGVANDPRFVDPVQQWGTDDASPSGIAIAGDTIFIANLRGERLRAVNIADPAGSTEYYPGGYGRLRDVVVAPDGTLWILTNNTDGRGDPQDGDDRILGVALSPA